MEHANEVLEAVLIFVWIGVTAWGVHSLIAAWNKTGEQDRN
jgi:hypothetical protein